MPKILNQQKIKKFKEVWLASQGSTREETHKFWLELLSCLGKKYSAQFIDFAKKVQSGQIDGYIRDANTLITHKNKNVNLDLQAKQADGALRTPFEEALHYANDLAYREKPKWIIVTNFDEIRIYDLDTDDQSNYATVFLKDIDTEYSRLNFLVNSGNTFAQKELDISIRAGKLIGKLYAALLSRCQEKSTDALHDLNIFCVRLVFLLYAEYAGVLSRKNQFLDYVLSFNPQQLSDALKILFFILNIPEDKRKDPNYNYFNNPDLLAFPYIHGGLFDKHKIRLIPVFDQEVYDLLVNEVITGFNWSGISPTTFGTIFESTLNPETRHQGGMHYTYIENIHKVIDPLFLDKIKGELDEITSIKVFSTKKKKINDFLKKIGDLTFFDPACGSGNFLTETFISLRKLENEALTILAQGQEYLVDIIHVSLNNFYGIEINDFSVIVAKTALWIAENQMLQDTISITKHKIDLLSLKSYANIIEGNALQLDWNEILSNDKCNYILGNPPFVGASMMTKQQKEDARQVFGKVKLANSIDYVGAWYHKAVAYMNNKPIYGCFVSTNSITQGEQVAALWKPICEKYHDFRIIFAWRTFKWFSESINMADVHCVVIGFASFKHDLKQLQIYEENSQLNSIKVTNVDHINQYLICFDDIFIESRSKPLCDVPKIVYGNKPTDDGNFILTVEEKNKLIEEDSTYSSLIKEYLGANEFINGKKRFCLWLKDCNPSDIHSKFIQDRIENIRKFRLNSSALPTQKKAKEPHLFFFISQPASGNFLVIPRVSSERREYIPIGFLDSNKTIASDALQIIPDANLYSFGILTSSVHMTWMKTIAGRLEMRYRYSNAIVYNNFPWPDKPKDTSKIETLAKAILEARDNYPNSCLANLYDPLLMPKDLRRAHKNLDCAILQLYGLDNDSTENDIINKLFSMYLLLIDNSK